MEEPALQAASRSVNLEIGMDAAIRIPSVFAMKKACHAIVLKAAVSELGAEDEVSPPDRVGPIFGCLQRLAYFVAQ